MQLKTNAYLLGLIDKSFKNKQGDDVAYREATLVVDGEVFKMSVDKSIEPVADNEQVEATIDITSRDGKLKMRLVALN